MTADPGIITNKGYEIFTKNNTLLTTTTLYIATGTGATAAALGDTALVAENTLYGSARAVATVTYTATGILTINKLFAFTGNVTVREIGVLDEDNNLLYRRVLSDNRNYTDGSSQEHTIEITFAAAV